MGPRIQWAKPKTELPGEVVIIKRDQAVLHWEGYQVARKVGYLLLHVQQRTVPLPAQTKEVGAYQKPQCKLYLEVPPCAWTQHSEELINPKTLTAFLQHISQGPYSHWCPFLSWVDLQF